MGMIVQSKYRYIEKLVSCVLENKAIIYLTVKGNSGVTKLVSHLVCWFFLFYFLNLRMNILN